MRWRTSQCAFNALFGVKPAAARQSHQRGASTAACGPLRRVLCACMLTSLWHTKDQPEIPERDALHVARDLPSLLEHIGGAWLRVRARHRGLAWLGLAGLVDVGSSKPSTKRLNADRLSGQPARRHGATRKARSVHKRCQLQTLPTRSTPARAYAWLATEQLRIPTHPGSCMRALRCQHELSSPQLGPARAVCTWLLLVATAVLASTLPTPPMRQCPVCPAPQLPRRCSVLGRALGQGVRCEGDLLLR